MEIFAHNAVEYLGVGRKSGRRKGIALLTSVN
jgi:hypothetical protein